MAINIATEFGGAEKSISDILHTIEKNYDCEIKFIVENEKMKQTLSKKGLEYKSIKLGEIRKNLLGILKIIYGVILVVFQILRYSPDIILTNTDISHIIGGLASIFTFKKFTWVLRDYNFNKLALKFLDPFVNKVIFVSNHIKEFYYNNNSDKLIVIPNGINLSDINKKYSLKFKENYSDNEEIIFGIATRFVKWKGVHNLIKSFNKVNDELNSFNAKLLIAGEAKDNSKENDYKNELKKMAKKYNLNNKVKFIGWIDDIFEFFKSCDVVVSSSTRSNGGPESFGRTIIEAWCMKKPVISTDCGGPRDLIDHYKDGIKVDEYSLDELSNAMIKLYRNKNLRDDLGENGYRKIISDYNIKRVSQLYFEALC